MSNRQMRAVLDIDTVDYKRLDSYVSRTFTGAKKTAAHLILRGLDAVSESNANQALVTGANKFKSVILYVLNQAAAELGIRFSEIALEINASKLRAILDIGKLDYQRLDSYLSRTLAEPKKTAAHLVLCGLDAVPAASANEALIQGANAFNGDILDALNQAASDFGVRFSGVSLGE